MFYFFKLSLINRLQSKPSSKQARATAKLHPIPIASQATTSQAASDYRNARLVRTATQPATKQALQDSEQLI